MEERQKGLYLGVDIGGTFAKIGMAEEDGNFLYTSEYPVDFDGYETPILDTVIKSSGFFLEEHGVAPEQVRGIGVSATGSVNTVTGVVDGGVGHIRNWVGSRIKERMEERFHVPTYVLNDANAAALGEVWLGAAAGRRNVVAVTVGTGVGGGIIVNSELLLGRDGFAGEIGHMVMDYGGAPCPCGNRGCWEQYASATALVRMVRQEVAEGKIEGITPEEIDGRRIFEEMEKGSQEMIQVADRWMDFIAAGIVSMVHIFNPETVILGGGVSAQKELFVEPVRRKVAASVRPEFAGGLEIVPAKLANRAGMAGAVYYCMQSLGQVKNPAANSGASSLQRCKQRGM